MIVVFLTWLREDKPSALSRRALSSPLKVKLFAQLQIEFLPNPPRSEVDQWGVCECHEHFENESIQKQCAKHAPLNFTHEAQQGQNRKSVQELAWNGAQIVA